MLRRLATSYNITSCPYEQRWKIPKMARSSRDLALRAQCVFCAHLAFTPRTSRNFRRIFEHFCHTIPDGCELHLACDASCHKLHPVQYEVTYNVAPLVLFHCRVVFMARGGGSKGRSPFFHVKSRQHKAPTLVASGRCLPGARCTLHGATPAGHGPHHVDAGTRGEGGVQTLQHHPCGRRPWRRCGTSGHSIYLGPRRNTQLLIWMKVYPRRPCGPQCNSSHSVQRRASLP